MKYRIRIGAHEVMLSAAAYRELVLAIQHHELVGYRDGETRLCSVVITECGERYPAES